MAYGVQDNALEPILELLSEGCSSSRYSTVATASTRICPLSSFRAGGLSGRVEFEKWVGTIFANKNIDRQSRNHEPIFEQKHAQET